MAEAVAIVIGIALLVVGLAGVALARIITRKRELAARAAQPLPESERERRAYIAGDDSALDRMKRAIGNEEK